MVQWLGLCDFAAQDAGSIPDEGTKILGPSLWDEAKKNVVVQSVEWGEKELDEGVRSKSTNFQL